jgi:hypothetical protein
VVENKKKKKHMAMTETEVRAALEEEIRGAVGYTSSELSNQRKTALEYYYGEPFGNEVEGRSSYVSRDVADTIEWIMPSLMRIFTGGDTIVKFEPQGPEDEKNAQQATDYVNYIFQKQNDGFLTLYTWFKDALLSKNGFVKVYWEEYDESKTESYERLTDDEMAMILQEEGIEPLEHSMETLPDGTNLHSLKARITTKGGKCCVDPIPPEEVLVSKNPTSPLLKNRFVAHRRRVTISELKAMGFEDVDDIADSEADFNEEKTARFSFDETDVGADEKTQATREVWLAECYVKMDVDDDGIAEDRTIIMAGDKILQNEEGRTSQLVSITPIILPHKLYGMSVADLVMDLQLLKSTVFRQILDNMYLANNGRYMALDGMVNIDDLLTSRPGGIVRVKTFDAVKPMQPPLLGAPAFNMLEYIDTIKENRTGVTRYNQGVDADSLNKTAQGINQIMSASQQRVELIARVFAETGVKDLFYAILEAVQKHQDKAKVIRLRNEWVQMDPREWDNKFDLSVTVGLGTGSKDAQIQALMATIQFQITALQGGLPIVTPENVYNTATKLLEAQNIKGADLFFTHPNQMPPPPPQQNPDAIKLEIEKMKGEQKAALQMMKDETKNQQMMMKQDFDAAKEQFKASVDIQKQREQQAGEVQKQREQQVGQAVEGEKSRQHEDDSKLLDILWEKKKGEDDADRSAQQEEMKAILAMIQDNTRAQNEAILKMIEASLAERETEVAERDAKGKVKKTVSRVKKKD